MNKNRGFNIIEVAMSIMVISIAILMITAIYTNIIQAQAKGIGKTTATAIAERVLQRIITENISELKKAVKTNGSSSKYTKTGKDIINNDIYYYYSAIYNTNFTGTNIVKIDVYVYWNLGDNKTTEEIINLADQTDIKNSVKFSRLFMISNEEKI